MTEMYVIDYAGARLRGDREGQYRAQRRAKDLYGTTYFNYPIALNAYWINRPKEAIKMLKALDLDDPWVSDWGGYWGVLTWAYHMIGQHEQGLKEAQREQKMNPESWGSLSHELEALSAMGKIDEINQVIEESYEFPPSQSWNPGDLMRLAGMGLRAYGYLEDSSQILHRALLWYEAQPQDVKKTRSHRYDVARILYHLEKWWEAQEIFKDLYDENPDYLPNFGYLGTIAARMGNEEEALRISEELKNIDRPYLHGENTYWRSRIAALLGEKEQAIELIRDSLLQGQTYNILYWNMDYECLEDYPPYIEIKKPKG
jgi:tetratricopeptide (TPR) repeat protein